MNKSKWDQQLEQYERRANVLRELREIVEHDPVFAREVAKLLLNGSTVDEPQFTRVRIDPQKQRKTQWERVCDYFHENGNEWSTVSEIADALNINRASTGHFFYKTRKDETEKRNHPAGGKLKQFRLAEPTASKSKED